MISLAVYARPSQHKVRTTDECDAFTLCEVGQEVGRLVGMLTWAGRMEAVTSAQSE